HIRLPSFPYTTLFRSPRDASATRAVEDLGVAALLGRHRADDGLDAAQLGFVEVVERLPVLAHVRQHAQHLLDAAHVLQLLNMGQDRKSTRLNSSHVSI